MISLKKQQQQQQQQATNSVFSYRPSIHVVLNRELLSSDTKKDGGPQLLFDHQICIDEVKKVIFVFGGRMISSTGEQAGLSGLYLYSIYGKFWQCIIPDDGRGCSLESLLNLLDHSQITLRSL